MHKGKEILEYEIKEACYTSSIVQNQKEKDCKRNHYEQSMDALIQYMENHEKNPSERRWNEYAIHAKFLSSKTIGYLSGTGFNTLCRKKRKEINKEKRQ